MSKQNRTTRSLGNKFALTVLWGMSIICLTTAAFEAFAARERQSWPTADGKVVSDQPVGRTRKLTYNYEVDGKTYTGSVFTGLDGAVDRSALLIVSVDPANPENSAPRMGPGSDKSSTFILIGGGMFIVGALVFRTGQPNQRPES